MFFLILLLMICFVNTMLIPSYLKLNKNVLFIFKDSVPNTPLTNENSAFFSNFNKLPKECDS